MTYYDYTVVPAPRRVKKVKGIGGGSDLFAHALTEAINAMAQQGWQYLRSETMAAEEVRGLFRRKVTAEHTVLVFCRPRETTDVRRLAREGAAGKAAPRGPHWDAAEQATPQAERAVVERMQGARPRTEPRVPLEPVREDAEETGATALHPPLRLGPAEKP